MNRPNKGFVAVLCALAVLVLGCVWPQEGEAAARSVRRAPVRAGAARANAAPRVFARGTGTQRSPYVISTAAHLAAFAASVTNGTDYAGKYVRLGADIDLKDTVWVSAGSYASGNSRSFKGFFNGGEFTIYNMGAGNAGRPGGALFGALDGAAVENVSLQFVEVAGESNVGALAGFMTGGSIKNCLVSGTVKGQSAVGGFVGSALNGAIENCNFSGEVEGADGVGGMAGAVDRTTIRSSAVAGHVRGNSDVGGFVGGVLDGAIANCSAANLVVSGERNVGGLIGNMIDGGYINQASFSGQAIGNSRVGGAVGHMTAGTVMACSVSGSVKGRENAGGIAGELADGNIRGCSSAAAVDGMTSIGGIVGLMSGGNLMNNSNRGLVSGGEAVGGVAGNFAGGDLDFSSNGSAGHVNGYLKTGPITGARSGQDY